jgi:hypothetical protein
MVEAFEDANDYDPYVLETLAEHEPFPTWEEEEMELYEAGKQNEPRCLWLRWAVGHLAVLVKTHLDAAGGPRTPDEFEHMADDVIEGLPDLSACATYAPFAGRGRRKKAKESKGQLDLF